MKTIPVEELNEQLTKALEQQDEHEAIGLTKDADTVAWVIKVPKELQDSKANVTLFGEGPTGRVFIAQADRVLGVAESERRTPVFGAGRGSLTIISEDDEHLKDFQEYLK